MEAAGGREERGERGTGAAGGREEGSGGELVRDPYMLRSRRQASLVDLGVAESPAWDHEADLRAGEPLRLPSPAVGLEGVREELTKVRRRATTVCNRILQMRELIRSPCDADDLEYEMEIAEELSNKMIELRAADPEVRQSSHYRDITRALSLGRRAVERQRGQEVSRPEGTVPLQPLTVRPAPTLQVPEVPLFSGADHNVPWEYFWGLFEAAIVSQPGLNDAQKLSFLLPRLTGEAANAVRGYRISSTNYAIIVQALKRRFEKPDRRRESLLTRVVSMNPLEIGSPDLRRRIDELSAMIRELDNMGALEGEGQVLRTTIEGLLPVPWRERWVRKKRSQPSPRLAELLAYIEEEMDVREEARGTTEGAQRRGREERPGARPVPAPRRSLTASLAVATQRAPDTAKCPACGKGPRHPLPQCNSFLGKTPQERYTIVRSLGRTTCFNCLGGHAAADCRSRYTCRNCGARHHTLLCGRKAREEVHQPQVRCSAVSGTTSNPVFSKAARCRGLGPGTAAPLLAVFDGGAEYSFVTEALAERLRLKIIDSQVFACVGWRARKEAYRRHFRVALRLQNFTTGATVQIEPWVVPRICAPLKRKTIPDHPALQDIPLADDGQGGPVDVLIGSDEYYKVIKHAHIELTPTLRALDTLLGWVLHGVKGPGSVPGRSTASLLLSTSPTHGWELDAVGLGPGTEEEKGEVVPSPVWNGARYETPLLWVGMERPTTNLASARTRVERMWGRLGEDQRSDYRRFMEEKEEEGVIRRSPVEWASRESQFFLPHRAAREGKFRVFFDGGASDGVGRPLNSYLSVGPAFLPKLLAVLLRFRIAPVGVQADVQAAFHSVSLAEEDRPYVQFYFDGHVYHFCRLVFGLVCSPVLWNAVVEKVLTEGGASDLVGKMRDALYFDDLALGFDSPQAAEEGIEEGVNLFRQHGLTLHKVRISGRRDEPAKILGLTWTTDSDLLSTGGVACPTAPTTPRSLLALVHKVWDPLGVLSPWSVGLKLLAQQAWLQVKRWDGGIPTELGEKLAFFLRDLDTLVEVKVPRLCAQFPFAMECFVDASSVACCAVVYLSLEGERRLLVAKTRLASSSQQLTVPRLELVAAVMGVRLAQFALRAFSRIGVPTSVLYYTDSQDVLYWLQRRKPLKAFVHNRVEEVLSMSSLEQWSYVPTKENPADLGTRGIAVSALANASLWWRGPDPVVKHVPFSGDCPSPTGLMEEKGMKLEVPVMLLQREFGLLDPTRFGTLNKLVAVTGWVFRFIQNAQKGERCMSPSLGVDELEKAKNFWIREAQEMSYPVEAIGQGKGPKELRSLRPSLGPQGVIHCRPRTREPSVVLLPRGSPITALIILDAHRKVFHQGVPATTSYLQSQYQVARVEVKRAIRGCGPCRRFRGLRFQGPEGGLPDQRIRFTRCFAHVGVDFWGPLYVEGGRKAYGLIFACSSSRAIHLELVHSQSAPDTLMALRRFFALRGEPTGILSDNAKSFRLLAKAMPQHIRWLTIPERSPWWGGFYERLIALVKRCLRTTFRLTPLNFEQLQVALYELGFHLNLRPLCSIEEKVLTPASFLYGVPATIHVLHPIVAGTIRGHWRQREAAMEDLRRRFVTEYLPLLRQWRNPNRIIRIPRVGEVVLVHDSGPRTAWKTGVVESLIVGSDGEVRAAHLRMGGGPTRRALERLYALEGNERTDGGDSDPKVPDGGGSDPRLSDGGGSDPRLSDDGGSDPRLSVDGGSDPRLSDGGGSDPRLSDGGGSDPRLSIDGGSCPKLSDDRGSGPKLPDDDCSGPPKVSVGDGGTWMSDGGGQTSSPEIKTRRGRAVKKPLRLRT